MSIHLLVILHTAHETTKFSNDTDRKNSFIDKQIQNLREGDLFNRSITNFTPEQQQQQKTVLTQWI